MLIGGRDTIGNARIKNFAVSLFFPAASLFPLFDPRGKSINGQRNVSSPISIETKDIYEHVSRMRKDRCVKPSRPRSRFLIWRASTGSWGRPANNRIINRNISQPRDHLPRLGILFESSETFQVKSVKEVITRGMRQFQHTFHPPKVFLSFPQIREKFFSFSIFRRYFCRFPTFLFPFYKFVESLTNRFQSILIITCIG